MCDCIGKINDVLRPHNTELTVPLFGPQRLFVTTNKIDPKKRGRPMLMFVTHCPFCGEKVPDHDSLKAPNVEGSCVSN